MASERTSSKSSAASSRSAAGPVSAVTRATTGGGYAPAASASRITSPIVRTPATSGTTSAETSPPRCERACDRLAVCGCWLAQASAMAESASSVVSQSTRSTPVWASTTSRPPPLADSTAARSAGRDRAQLLEQVLGDAARVEGGAGQLPGDAAQLGEQPGRLGVRLRGRLAAVCMSRLHGAGGERPTSAARTSHCAQTAR